MSVIDVDFSQPVSSPFAEVLTATRQEAVLGYRLGGHSAGPDVLVAGFDPVAEAVFDRLVALPTLAWLRGRLTLINLTQLDQTGENRRLAGFFDPRPDDLLFLPYLRRDRGTEAAARDGYWAVLRLCTELGMISGRGVPPAALLRRTGQTRQGRP